MFMFLFGIGWVAPNKEALLPSFILCLGLHLYYVFGMMSLLKLKNGKELV